MCFYVWDKIKKIKVFEFSRAPEVCCCQRLWRHHVTSIDSKCTKCLKSGLNSWSNMNFYSLTRSKSLLVILALIQTCSSYFITVSISSVIDFSRCLRVSRFSMNLWQFLDWCPWCRVFLWPSQEWYQNGTYFWSGWRWSLGHWREYWR